MGIGVNNVWHVAYDERGRMIPAELEKKILEAKDKVRVKLFIYLSFRSIWILTFRPLKIDFMFYIQNLC